MIIINTLFAVLAAICFGISQAQNVTPTAGNIILAILFVIGFIGFGYTLALLTR